MAQGAAVPPAASISATTAPAALSSEPVPSSALPRSFTTTCAPRAGEEEGIGTAEPVPRTGDDRDAVVEAEFLRVGHRPSISRKTAYHRLVQLRDVTDLVALFADEAEPEWVALEQDGRFATTRQLGAWMGSAAAALADGSSDVVAVSTGDVIEHTVGFLGALAAGRPPLLVDPKHPDALLESVVGRAGATVTVGRAVPGVPCLGFGELIERPPAARVRVDAGEPGSLLLTSGSTGEPKIVVRSRAADMGAAGNFRLEHFPIESGERFWLSSPFTGSPWPGIVWSCLLARATVVFAPLPDAAIGALLDDLRIDSTFLGPTAARLAFQRDGLEGPGGIGCAASSRAGRSSTSRLRS